MRLIGNLVATLIVGSAAGCLHEIWLSGLPQNVTWTVTPMVLVGASVLAIFARQKFSDMEKPTDE